MANKAISELPQAQNVNNQDLFVLEQSGIAKKLTAETFITEQGIIDALAEALDGHGGIASVTLSSVSGRIRTYLITFTDETTTTFQVYDGTSIDRIAKTSTAGLTDTYTVFMNDGSTTFFTVTNGADGTVSEAMLNDALKNKAPAITETTESSAIANFTDGADDLVMHNIVAEINPVQDLSNGDPSPSNICPISGWTGCNVTRTGVNAWNEEWEVGDINASGVNATANDRIRSKNYVPVKPSTTYYIKAPYGVWFWGYNENKEYVERVPTTSSYNNQTITVPSDIYYLRFVVRSNYGTTYNNDISINYPPTDTAYHAFAGSNSVSLSWQTETGTVYGGTIDVATGLLTSKMAKIVLDGTQTISLANWRPTSGSVGAIFPYTLTNNKVLTSDAIIPNVFSDKLKTVSYSDAFNGRSDCCVSMIAAANGTSIYGMAIRINDPSLTTAALFNAYLAQNPVEVVYELATPQTYQLTPQEVLHTLYGVNNVWADTGNVSVTYPADTKMFIEKLTMPTEDDMTANQAITSGKFFMVGNNLYLATAAIASGAKIIEGTNATRLSLADALNRL